MKTFAVLFAIVALSGTALAQPPAAPNALYVEFPGNGLIYSCNYDRLFSDAFGARIGISYTFPEEVSLVTIPLMGYYLVGLGSGNSKLEFGLGAAILLQPKWQSLSFMAAIDYKLTGNTVVGTATVGYRYQRPDGGFIFRVGFTPFFGQFKREKEWVPYQDIEYEDSFRFVPWGGISLGYGF